MKRWLADFEESLSVLFLGLLLVTLFLQIFTRFVLNDPLVWTEEMSRVLFIYSTLFGMVTAIKQRAHVRIDFFVGFLPAKVRKWLTLLLDLVVVVTLVYLVVLGYQMAVMQHRMFMVSMDIRLSVLYGVFPVAAALMVLRLVQRMVFDVRIPAEEVAV